MVVAASSLTNLREVGGAGLQRGRRRTVYRSNTDPVDQQAYPSSVEIVVDLRRVDEIAALAHPLARSSGYRSVPLFDPAVKETSGAPTVQEEYVDWLDRHRAAIAAVFRAIGAADGDVLVCCAAGKDRTGVVSALLARLWGAGLDLIGSDYAATRPALVERFAREREQSTDLALTTRNQECRPETAQYVVRSVEERYGSVRGYLRWIGLSEPEIDAL